MRKNIEYLIYAAMKGIYKVCPNFRKENGKYICGHRKRRKKPSHLNDPEMIKNKCFGSFCNGYKKDVESGVIKKVEVYSVYSFNK